MKVVACHRGTVPCVREYCKREKSPPRPPSSAQQR